MTEVIIENVQDKVEIEEQITKTISEACLEALAFEECDFNCEISVTIVDNDEIQSLNSEFRGKDMPTDVLSFPMLEFDEEGNAEGAEYSPETGNVLLGDIVISAERAKEQAESFGHSFLREMAFLTVHSMLHLLGYDHVDDAEGERLMFAKQKDILERMNITRES